VVAVATPHLAIVGSPGERVERNERMNWLASLADGGDDSNA
jgi:hypothetical protein